MADIITAFGTLSPLTQCLGCVVVLIIAFFCLVFLEELASALLTIHANKK